MADDTRALNAGTIAEEMAWLAAAIDQRIAEFFEAKPVAELPAPPVLDAQSVLGQLIRAHGLEGPGPRIALGLGLAAHVQPSLLDPFLLQNASLKRPFTEFGGVTQPHFPGFIPTVETALFVIAGCDMAARSAHAPMFSPDAPLISSHLVHIEQEGASKGVFGGILAMRDDTVHKILTGVMARPNFAPDFPAQYLSTAMTADDLVLPRQVMDQIEHIEAWIKHEPMILDDWGLRARLSPGYRVLFYGPPGTGKTLTATILGQRTGRDVYRIDLSKTVSKYIGETEKNLSRVFDEAERRSWILFFDEADALFAKRTSGGSVNDRYANQEVSYLLQRIEMCSAVTILATNLRSNIDDAFSRRFQSLVGFVKPDQGARLQLWTAALSGSGPNGTPVPRDDTVDLHALAQNYELVGGAIVNVVRFATVSALRRGAAQVGQKDLLSGIAFEFRKEGRTP